METMRSSACTCLLILATVIFHAAKADIDVAAGLDLNAATASFRVAANPGAASESLNSEYAPSAGTFAMMVAVAICVVLAGHSRQWVFRLCGYIWDLQVQFTRAFLIYTLSNKSGQPIVLNGGGKDLAEAKNKSVRPPRPPSTHGVRRDFSLSSSLNSGYGYNLSTRHKSWVLEQSLKQATLENSPMLLAKSPHTLPRQSKQQELWPAHSPVTASKAVSPGKTKIIQMQVSDKPQPQDPVIRRESVKPNVGRLRELDLTVNGGHKLLNFTLDDDDDQDRSWSDNDDGDPRAPPVPSGDPMEGEDVGLNPRTELKLPPPATGPQVLGVHGRKMVEVPWEVPPPSVNMAMKSLRQTQGSRQPCYMP